MDRNGTTPGSAVTNVVRSPDTSLRRALASHRRFARGLLATGLLEDLREGGAFTLLAPIDEAFDSLPGAFDDLLVEPDRVEDRFNLFEYLVLRGLADGAGPRATFPTLHGASVRIGRHLVLGRYGASRIVRTFDSERLRVHVLEQCVFPTFPRPGRDRADIYALR